VTESNKAGATSSPFPENIFVRCSVKAKDLTPISFDPNLVLI
jgi:hypothetical protein